MVARKIERDHRFFPISYASNSLPPITAHKSQPISSHKHPRISFRKTPSHILPATSSVWRGAGGGVRACGARAREKARAERSEAGAERGAAGESRPRGRRSCPQRRRVTHHCPSGITQRGEFLSGASSFVFLFFGGFFVCGARFSRVWFVPPAIPSFPPSVVSFFYFSGASFFSFLGTRGVGGLPLRCPLST
jgi:hypothetical protein